MEFDETDAYKEISPFSNITPHPNAENVDINEIEECSDDECEAGDVYKRVEEDIENLTDSYFDLECRGYDDEETTNEVNDISSGIVRDSCGDLELKDYSDTVSSNPSDSAYVIVKNEVKKESGKFFIKKHLTAGCCKKRIVHLVATAYFVYVKCKKK